MEIRPQVSNVKIHFKYRRSPVEVPDNLKHYIRWYSNFFTIGLSRFTYVVFYRSGHVNCSGLRNFEQVNKAVRVFYWFFQGSNRSDFDGDRFTREYQEDLREGYIVIDNSTACGHVGLSCINFQKLKYREQGVTLFIRQDHFPSALFRNRRTRADRQKRPSIILFTNGKFIIVGARSYKEIFEAYETLLQIMKASFPNYNQCSGVEPEI